MENREIAICMANGNITCVSGEMNAGDMEWNAHPSFRGVSLKHLIRGKDTAGHLSCHMVRIDPGCALKPHTHEGEWELHEVIGGSGDGVLEDREISYHPGRMTVIPKGTVHEVVAGEKGLTLLAKFFPALL